MSFEAAAFAREVFRFGFSARHVRCSTDLPLAEYALAYRHSSLILISPHFLQQPLIHLIQPRRLTFRAVNRGTIGVIGAALAECAVGANEGAEEAFNHL